MKGYSLGSMKGSSVLITGGLGFIGSNIAHKAVSLGAKVTIFDACLDPYGWNFANIKEIRKKIEFIKGDTRDFGQVSKAVKNKDFIIDCAAQVSHTISIKNPLLDIDINCRGTMNVLEATRQFNDKAKMVYAGTRGQIGKMVYSPIDENHPTNPIDMNGIDKLAAEKYYLTYYKVYGMRTTSIRINNTYGIRSQMKHNDYGIVNWFIRLALEGKPITLFGDGKQTRDYNYVEDVADAMLLATQSKKSEGNFFMLGSGKSTKLIDMVKMIIEITGKGGIVTKPWPAERKKIEIGDFLVSYEKINNMLGWYPKTNLKEGLTKTVDFYRKRLKEYI